MKRAAGSDAQPDAKKAAVDNPHGVEMDESRVVRPLKAYKVRALGRCSVSLSQEQRRGTD